MHSAVCVSTVHMPYNYTNTRQWLPTSIGRQKLIRNVLGTETAELVYGQILDGLPLRSCIEESFPWIPDHPVNTLSHFELCQGFIDKAREFLTEFDLTKLRFQKEVSLTKAVIIVYSQAN